MRCQKVKWYQYSWEDGWNSLKGITFTSFANEIESQAENDPDDSGRDEHTEKLFDQDSNEEEDFEIPAFLRKQKF